MKKKKTVIDVSFFSAQFLLNSLFYRNFFLPKRKKKFYRFVKRQLSRTFLPKKSASLFYFVPLPLRLSVFVDDVFSSSVFLFFFYFVTSGVTERSLASSSSNKNNQKKGKNIILIQIKQRKKQEIFWVKSPTGHPR